MTQALRKIIALFITGMFAITSVIPVYAEPPILTWLPQPNVRLDISPEFSPVLLRGIQVDPLNPFAFHFIVDSGDDRLDGQDLEDESLRLVRYFLAALTIPEKDLWVNLSPYEKDRIVPEGFGQTDMGRDLLALDYLLKQVTSSLLYPEGETGKVFWKRVYKQAFERFGTTSIPVNTFNKVWIVPEAAKVYEDGNVAFVGGAHLKVMLEEDYKALGHTTDEGRGTKDDNEKSGSALRNDEVNQLGSQIVREIVIPELEKEINTGKNFAKLRQIYYSLILATWYKKRMMESLLGQKYVDQRKTPGVDIDDKEIKHKIYEQYLEAFKKGVYNYIKEEYDPALRMNVPRKYFSGGASLLKTSAITDYDPLASNEGTVSRQFKGKTHDVNIALTNPNAPKPETEASRAAKSIDLNNLPEGQGLSLERSKERITVPYKYLDNLRSQTALARKLDIEIVTELFVKDGKVVGSSPIFTDEQVILVEYKSQDEKEVTENSADFDRVNFVLSLLRNDTGIERESDLQMLSDILDSVTVSFYSHRQNGRVTVDKSDPVSIEELLSELQGVRLVASSWFGSRSTEDFLPKEYEGLEIIRIHNHPNKTPAPPSAVSKEAGTGDIYNPEFFLGVTQGLILDTADAGDQLFFFHEPDASREEEYVRLYNLYWWADGNPANGLDATQWIGEQRKHSRSVNEQQVIEGLRKLAVDVSPVTTEASRNSNSAGRFSEGLNLEEVQGDLEFLLIHTNDQEHQSISPDSQRVIWSFSTGMDPARIEVPAVPLGKRGAVWILHEMIDNALDAEDANGTVPNEKIIIEVAVDEDSVHFVINNAGQVPFEDLRTKALRLAEKNLLLEARNGTIYSKEIFESDQSYALFEGDRNNDPGVSVERIQALPPKEMPFIVGVSDKQMHSNPRDVSGIGLGAVRVKARALGGTFQLENLTGPEKVRATLSLPIRKPSSEASRASEADTVIAINREHVILPVNLQIPEVIDLGDKYTLRLTDSSNDTIMFLYYYEEEQMGVLVLQWDNRTFTWRPSSLGHGIDPDVPGGVNHRGKGLGTRAYQQLKVYFGVLASRGITSAVTELDAQRMWQRLGASVEFLGVDEFGDQTGKAYIIRRSSRTEASRSAPRDAAVSSKVTRKKASRIFNQAARSVNLKGIQNDLGFYLTDINDQNERRPRDSERVLWNIPEGIDLRSFVVPDEDRGDKGVVWILKEMINNALDAQDRSASRPDDDITIDVIVDEKGGLVHFTIINEGQVPLENLRKDALWLANRQSLQSTEAGIIYSRETFASRGPSTLMDVPPSLIDANLAKDPPVSEDDIRMLTNEDIPFIVGVSDKNKHPDPRGGSGIGLGAVLARARALGGTVRLENLTEQNKVRTTLSLPVARRIIRESSRSAPSDAAVSSKVTRSEASRSALGDQALGGAIKTRLVTSLLPYVAAIGAAISAAQAGQFSKMTFPHGYTAPVVNIEPGDTISALIERFAQLQSTVDEKHVNAFHSEDNVVWPTLQRVGLVDRDGVLQPAFREMDFEQFNQTVKIFSVESAKRLFDYLSYVRVGQIVLDSQLKERLERVLLTTNPVEWESGGRPKPGQRLDLNAVEDVINFMKRLKPENLIGHTMITVNGQPMEFYILDTEDDASLQGTRVAEAGHNIILINLNGMWNDPKYRRQGMTSADDSIKQIVVRAFADKTDAEIVLSKLKEMMAHEGFGHVLTMPRVNKGKVVLFPQSASSLDLAATHEVSGLLAQIAGSDNPIIPFLETVLLSQNIFFEGGREYVIASRLIKERMFDELDFVNYLVQSFRKEKGRQGSQPRSISEENFRYGGEVIRDVINNLRQSGYIDENNLITNVPFLSNPSKFEIKGGYDAKERERIYTSLLKVYDQDIWLLLTGYWDGVSYLKEVKSFFLTLAPDNVRRAAEKIHLELFQVELPSAELLVIPETVRARINNKFAPKEQPSNPPGGRTVQKPAVSTTPKSDAAVSSKVTRSEASRAVILPSNKDLDHPAAVTSLQSVGGIDLDPAAMKFDIESIGPSFNIKQYSPEQLKAIEINGLTPNILSIQPIPNLWQFLGYKEQSNEPGKFQDIVYSF